MFEHGTSRLRSRCVTHLSAILCNTLSSTHREFVTVGQVAELWREFTHCSVSPVTEQTLCFTSRALFKSFRTGRLERELQMVQLSTTSCSCIAILWVSIVSFGAITLCIASQRVIPKISVYFVIDSIRKLLDIPSFNSYCPHISPPKLWNVFW
jgi:hypothetical protein